MNMNFIHFLLILIPTVSFCLKSEFDKEWDLYKQVHGKKYSPDENLNRRTIWEEAVQKVAAHNRRYDMKLSTYRMGLNPFTDLTFNEFSNMYTSKMPMTNKTRGNNQQYVKKGISFTGTHDWRSYGAVTGVKDQGHCGSCWSFSATGSLEGQWYLGQKGPLTPLSEQNLIDCSKTVYGNKGCLGGIIDYAFAYIRDYGIMTESDYPYKAIDSEPCTFDSTKVAAKISSFQDIPFADEEALTEAIYTVGPISVAIDATANLQHYAGGVLDDDSCDAISLNHGVLALGFGSDGGSHYYIIKNSWGSSWGDKGYLKMSRDKNNQCGIASLASYPIV